MKLPPRVNPCTDTREKQIERIAKLEQTYGHYPPLQPFDFSTWSNGDIKLYEEALRCDLETRGEFAPGTVDPPVIMYDPKTPEVSLNGAVTDEHPEPFLSFPLPSSWNPVAEADK